MYIITEWHFCVCMQSFAQLTIGLHTSFKNKDLKTVNIPKIQYHHSYIEYIDIELKTASESMLLCQK